MPVLDLPCSSEKAILFLKHAAKINIRAACRLCSLLKWRLACIQTRAGVCKPQSVLLLAWLGVVYGGCCTFAVPVFWVQVLAAACFMEVLSS